MSEWREARLGDVVSITHGWPFVGELCSEEITGKPIIVSIGNFRYTGGFRFEETMVREYRGDYPKEFELTPNEILLVMTCQTAGGEILGIPARVPDDGRTYLHNPRMGKVVVKRPDLIDEDYLYWLFLWSEFNRELFLSATGTKILHTAPTRIEAFRFPRPPLAEQRAIAAVLGALDDKIELNRRMNETLEAMARALFQNWFVDATQAGLPKGWHEGTLGEVAENPRRGVQPDKIKPATPYIGLEHMPRRCIALSDWGQADELESNKFEFERVEILFGKLRPYFHKVGVAPLDGVCSTDILVVTPKGPSWFGFVLGHVSRVELVNHTNASTGTKMPRTNWNDIARFEVALPPESLAAEFTERIRAMIDRIIANIHESRTLAALRDALLPKNDVLFDGRKGTPVMFFVGPEGNKRSVPDATCNAIETFLIQSAYAENPEICNRQQTKIPDWTIKGVVRPNQGAPTKLEVTFRKMMGIGVG